ncbi:MAG: DUF2254 domain-containing protein, partial [Akkermansiaceae bacterium]|nr:DUF2254 domain-containing protein [Akkermansiaceae bacterium]
MMDRLRFLVSRIRQQLWVRPLIMCLISVGVVFLARTADRLPAENLVPDLSLDTTETLLKILASSMLVIATFAVGSMVSSYASASGTATPRSFPLVIADDVSQNALSGFIGAFIFSIVALIGLKTGFYGAVGHFVLFITTLIVFAAVILIFMRWMDCIARLGRLGSTIDKVEVAAAEALDRRRCAPTLGGAGVTDGAEGRRLVFGETIGYVQRVDLDTLQEYAEEGSCRVEVLALPGSFAAPGQALARVAGEGKDFGDHDAAAITSAFVIGDDRTYEDDPR